MTDELTPEKSKSEKIIEDVYVATQTKDKVVLQGRNYEVLAEIPTEGVIHSLLLEGVCVCQKSKNWLTEDSESFWFCLDKNSNARAIAEVSARDGKHQVVMRQPGSSCEIK